VADVRKGTLCCVKERLQRRRPQGTHALKGRDCKQTFGQGRVGGEGALEQQRLDVARATWGHWAKEGAQARSIVRGTRGGQRRVECLQRLGRQHGRDAAEQARGGRLGQQCKPAAASSRSVEGRLWRLRTQRRQRSGA